MATRVKPEASLKAAPKLKRAISALAKGAPRQVAPAAVAKTLARDEFSTGKGRALRLNAPPRALSAGRAGPNRIDGRTTGDALFDMDRVFKGPRLSEDTPWGSKVTRNPPDVNDPSDWDWRTNRYKDAKTQVEANGPLEAQALKRMSPADREAYTAVRNALEKSGDVVALLSLQRLLFTGALPGQKDALGRMTTLGRLAEIANGRAPLADGISRTQLLTELVQELATPSAINQGPKNTCGPVTVMVELAMKNPAEYVRLAMDLASPRGECTLVGGLVVRREPGTERNDDSGRSLVQRVVGSALMEATKDTDYDPSTDVGSRAWASELARLHQAVFGAALSPLDRVTDPAQRRAMVDAAVADLKRGVPTPMVLDLGDGVLHWVLVTGREVRNGEEFIRYTNPWGQEEVISRAEFEKRLLCTLDQG